MGERMRPDDWAQEYTLVVQVAVPGYGRRSHAEKTLAVVRRSLAREFPDVKVDMVGVLRGEENKDE